jgi:hypothetical protein
MLSDCFSWWMFLDLVFVFNVAFLTEVDCRIAANNGMSRNSDILDLLFGYFWNWSAVFLEFHDA